MASITRHHLLIIILVAAKLTIHFITNSLYGLHRDEFLYIAEGEHLGWGYMEGPPMIAWLAKVAILLGKTTFTVRLLPALAGCLIVILMIRLLKHLGGSFSSQVVLGLALLFSPALLGSNTLFQPVSFNQLGWVTLSYLLFRLYQTQQARYWYFLGFGAGIALLTKYSAAFWLAALFISLLFTPHRKWLGTRHPYIALGITLIMFAPNLWWQIEHNWPLLVHMETLKSTQLVNVKPSHFLSSQLISQGLFLPIWASALFTPFLIPSLRQHRWFIIAALTTTGLLLYLSGKPYYLMGVFPPLLALGALGLDHWIRSKVLLVGLTTCLALVTMPLLPLAIPILPLNVMVDYSQFIQTEMGMEGPFRWEDGQVRPLRQDYADMHGWEEVVAIVAQEYHALTDEEKQKTQIYGGGYGHAGALNFYREKYDLPEAVSLNASFIMWTPLSFPYTRQIEVDDNWHSDSEHFQNLRFIDSIQHEWARDPGYVFIKDTPTMNLDSIWNMLVIEEKARFNF